MSKHLKGKLFVLLSLILVFLFLPGAGKSDSVKKPEAPQVSAESARWDGIKVSWKKVEGADGYRIYQKTSSGWEKQGDYKSTTCWVIVGNLEFNKEYTFTVRAYTKTDSGNVWGNYDKNGASAVTALNQPELGTVSSTGSGLQITWKEVKGAEGYRVYRKEDVSGAEWKRIAQPEGQSQSSYVDKDSVIGTKYYYTVRAYRVVDSKYILSTYDKKGIEGIRVQAEKPATPKVSASSARWDAVKVSWKKVAGADGYRVYIKTAKGWKKQGDYKSTTNWVIVGNLEFNKKYTFTVRAYTKTDSGNLWSGYDKEGASAVTALNAPELGKTSSTAGGLKVTWGKVKGAEGYRVYRKEDVSGAKWKRIAQLQGQSTESYTDKKASVGTKYYYTVRAYRTADSELILSSYDKKGIAGTRKEESETAGNDKPMVALTYDDGPSANTPKILDVLEKYDAKATFFVVGDRVDESSKYQSYVKRAYELGCQIGNHTYEHKTLTSLSESQIKLQISKCDKAVKNAAGITPSVMRPPGGNRNSTVDQAVGKPLILWSIDTRDWETRSSSETISAVLDNVKDGDIVLMHDLYSSTAEASETIIPALIKKGYQLVTVEELAEKRGGMKAGHRYSSFRP